MDVNAIPLFDLMQRKMAYLSERHAVLAQNIANADTPGYISRDVKTPDFKAALALAHGRTTLARTSPMHMDAGKAGKPAYEIVARKKSSETNPNGNEVAIEDEIQKLSMNQADYQQITSLYRKSVEMFRTAIGRPGA